MTIKPFSDVWDLEVFFPGGSSSPAFAHHLDETGGNIEEFAKAVGKYTPAEGITERKTVRHIIYLFEGTVKKIRQAGAFVSCLQAQNLHDKEADSLRGKVTELSARFQNVLTVFDGKLSQYEEKQWECLLEDEELHELSFVLTERRNNARQKLSEKEEMLINKLSVDGYHGWGQMYDTIVGGMQIPFEENGEVKFLSVGQAANKFSNPDRKVRKKVFVEWEKAWDEKGAVLAKTLNHLAGFRLNTYEMRNWHNVLKEPLEYNRMEEKTLEAMWRVISNNKKPFVEFLNRKAQLLGVEKLTWYDVDAPIGKTESKLSYQEGAEFILHHFENFVNEMTAFAKKAFENDWIEAEDRQGKRPGGFHTYFPESGQSRIFMTYSGTPSNVSTLAHELGHGFHTYAMRDMHTLNRNYAMNVAETASTLAEMIVADAAVKNAKSEEEKIILLEDKIQRSVALLMNIHARFMFETRFYEERRKGLVSKERLNELMTEAQKEAFGDALAEYHPSFWGSKLHFYITVVPFYNFPYTFGYLFSLGIYAKAVQEGKGYETKYISLLKDTASMSVEELAKKHLNVDLTDDAFWESAIKVCIEDVEEFLELTK